MSESTENNWQTLHTIFHDGLNLYNKISDSNEPLQSPQIQRDVQKAISLLEHATRLVSLADIFSTNESLNELSTNNIQYLLLPALLGFLTSKLTSRERKELIDVAEVYFKDFLKRTNLYGLSNYKFSDGEESEACTAPKTEFQLIEQSVSTRANKIQRFKEHKELKAQLANLKTNVENEHADEEIKRNYFLTMIKLFIHEVEDELDSFKMEKPILEHMVTMKNSHAPKPKREQPPPLNPIIITRDEVQKAIYGAGYPSLPTMTVQEFYDKRVAEGAFPDPNKPKTGPMNLQEASLAGISLNDTEDKEAEDLEKKIEDDDENHIQRMRERDEFKDDHRRGWGNRMNRS